MSAEDKQQQKQELARTNWADDQSDNDDDNGAEIGQASKPNYKVIDPKMSEQPKKKVMAPPEHRERNKNGDFVVTKIVIPDLKPVVKEVEKNESDEESEPESEEEPQAPEEESKEAAKKQPVKQLSKAEKKRLEDEEFERVFKEMGLEQQQQKPAETAKAEESK